MPAQVFISYSSKDRAVGHMVCALLEERGHRCWIAPRDIVPGREWGEAIVDGIKGASVFVLIFSQNANQSPQILREVERAVHHGMPIIPFRIEDVLPAGSLEYFMSVPHWLDALSPPVEGHIARLADVIAQFERGDARPDAGGVLPQRRGEASIWQHRLIRPALFGALLALLVAAAWLAGLAPPASATGWLAALIALTLPVALVAGRIGLPWQSRPFRLGLILLLALAAVGYGWARSEYIVAGANDAPVVRGTTCTEDAALIYGSACPALPADALADAAFDAPILWSSQSIARAEQLLAGSWLATIIAAALLLGGWLVPPPIRPRNPKEE